MIWLSIDVCFKWFWLSVDSNFKWGGCQLIWDSIDLVVNQFEIQMIWLSIDSRFKSWFSIDLRFKWFCCQSMCDSIDFVCQLISDSSELVVNWFEIQVIWLSNDLRFKWVGCQLLCDSNYFVKRSFSGRLPSKMKLWNSKTKLLCETSFKNEALKIKSEAFVRDFLQKWSFEASFCARRPSKMKLRTSKTKHFCQTSFKNDMLTARLTSELQYVLAIFKWMLQKYCACHEKVEPRHTKSCNCHAKWSLQSNTSVTWNL